MEDANYLTGQPINFQTATDISNPNNLSGMLREWIWVKTKFSICVLGEKGVGKSFLVNTLLEATFQDLVSSSPNNSVKSVTNNLEDDFFMIDVAPKKNKKKNTPPPSPQSHSNHSSSSNVSMPSQTSSANSSAPTSASSSASSLFSEFLEDEDFALQEVKKPIREVSINSF
jgi:GTPase SAR1 family protein